jgi:hypothetical protein
MGRLERRIFKLNDEIAAIERAIDLTREELRIHEHLDDDARRDAAVGGPLERDDARETSRDVANFRRLLDIQSRHREALVRKRDRLLARLG